MSDQGRRPSGWVFALVLTIVALGSDRAQAAFSLRRSFSSPSPAAGDRFGATVAHVTREPGTDVVVGAPGDATTAAGAGAAYLFGATSTDLKQTYLDPAGAAGDQLGAPVNVLGSVVCFGAPGADVGAADAGAIELFDIDTGTWLKTLGRPTAIAGEAFGTGLGSIIPSGDTPRVAVGGAGGGTVYLLDPITGDPVLSFANPTGAPGFGSTVYVASTLYVPDDAFVFVSSPNDGTGKVYEFDGQTGELIHTFVNPDSVSGEEFGASITLVNSIAFQGSEPSTRLLVLVGTPGAGDGVVHVFGGDDAQYVGLLTNPAPLAASEFGRTLTGTGTYLGNLLIGSPGGAEGGRVYVVQMSDLTVLEHLDNPTPGIPRFGEASAWANGSILVGAPGDAGHAGAAHLFTNCGDGGEDVGEVCDDGNQEDGDCCSPTCDGFPSLCGGAAPCDAPFTLRRVLHSPYEEWDAFGASIQSTPTDQILIGAPLDSHTVAYGGAVYLIDPTSGQIEHTYVSPSPAEFEFFGISVAAGIDWTAIGGPFFNPYQAANPGHVYPFDAAGAASAPAAPNQAPLGFGWSLAGEGSQVVVGSSGGGPAYLYDVGTGGFVATYADPLGVNEFALALAISADRVFIGSRNYSSGGAVHVYDRPTGVLLQTIQPPEPANGFGHSLALRGSHLLVGSRGPAVFEYDAATLDLIRTLPAPQPCAKELYFGTTVAFAGSNLLVGARPSRSDYAIPGAVYVFDDDTGTLRQTVLNPASTVDEFGSSLAGVGNSIVVGAYQSDIVYVFTICGDGVVDPGEECDDGNTTSGDDCSASCANELPPTTTSTSTSTTTTSSSTTTSTSSTTTTLPPDPSTVAPPVDQTVATTVFASTEFLYTGPNPIQTGVVAGTIVPKRAAVIRGRVLDRSTAPIGGVRITILNHPEYGQTLSRTDGAFDLVVNGGGPLTVNYTKSGYFTAQRTVNPPWQDYLVVADVVLVPPDAAVTPIDLSAATPIQVARGGIVTDTNGTRQATLLFPQGTTAALAFANGSTQPITELHVRATEYTVGATGLAAMPGELPPTTAYTYAAEYSADEAEAAGAAEVRFSEPVIFYLENFLGFPVGGPVPEGGYDRLRGFWVPSTDGRVVQVVAITGGLADLDITGDGVADSASALAALGVTDAERTTLATLYAVGQTLWRVPIPHFSAWDSNWGWGPPLDAEFPKEPKGMHQPPDQPAGGTCHESGSVISCETQSLGEDVPITGTPYQLHYESDRAPGRKVGLLIPLTDDSLPPHLLAVVLDVYVAGTHQHDEFVPATNLSTTFLWNGINAYGQPAQGSQRVTVRIGYVYPGVYYSAGLSNGTGGGFGYNGGGHVLGNATAMLVTLWQEYQDSLTHWNAVGMRLGAWDVDVHHVYDPVSTSLLRGDGTRQGAEDLNRVITTLVGSGINSVTALTFGPDGSLYIADEGNRKVRKRAPDGTMTTLAGANGELFFVGGVALGPDGSVYFSEAQRVKRITPQGTVQLFAGNGTQGFSGDGGPATAAQLDFATGLAVGSDGAVFIADGRRVRRVAVDGTIHTVAGNGVIGGGVVDGVQATQTRLSHPTEMAVTPDGVLYINDLSDNRIRRVGTDGIISTVAGGGAFFDENIAATDTSLAQPYSVAVDRDGTLYIGEAGRNRVRAVTPDGTIHTVACDGQDGFAGDGGAAGKAQCWQPRSVAIAPDGALTFVDFLNQRIRHLTAPLPGFTGTAFAVAARDGSELYQFDAFGRHLTTYDTLTGTPIRTFTYDGAGLLTQIHDRSGNTTTIDRGAAGAPWHITAPGGQITTATANAGGYFETISNPAGDTYTFTYHPGGLMATLETPRHFTYTFGYDLFGALSSDHDPAGGFKTLDGTGTIDTQTVDLETAEGRTTRYVVQPDFGLGTHRTVTLPTGLQQSLVVTQHGDFHVDRPDGSSADRQTRPDPRFGMQAPLTTFQARMLSGLGTTVGDTQTVTLANPADPLSVTSLTTTRQLAGFNFTSVYTAATHTIVDTTPLGRTRTTTLDSLGRVASVQVGSLAPISFTRDATGLLRTITEGTGPSARTTILDYDPKRRLATITDTLSQPVGFGYDDADRVTSQTFPDGKVVGFGYDASGNVTRVTPPGQPDHLFGYTPVDLEDDYTPPAAGLPTPETTYTYNLDRQLTQLLRPDGATVDFAYEPSGGRLETRTQAGETITFGYHPTRGQLTTLTSDLPGGESLALTYDSALVTAQTWTGPVAGTVGTSYNILFQPNGTTVNGTSPVALGYDIDNLLTQAGALTLTRHPQHGLVTGTTIGTAPNAITDAHTYTPFGEVDTYTASAGTTPLLDIAYDERDALGRITSKTEAVLGGTSHTTTYGYDLRGRLETVTPDTGPVVTYTYDDNGNRLTRQLNGTVVESGTYDAQDRLLTYAGATYTYTANGELETKMLGTSVTHYDYDALGNLRTVTLPNGTDIEYVIDPANRRVGKKVNGTIVQGFLYEDQLRIAAELDGAGNVRSRFVYGTRVNVPEYMVTYDASGATTGTYRLVTDHLGSPRLVIDVSTGAVAQRIDYDEFGRVTTDTGPGFQPFGFAGGLYDRDTGLERFGARDYDAATGRWTTKDPLRFDASGIDLYLYALDDPVNEVDVDGANPFFVGIAIGAISGAAWDIANQLASNGGELACIDWGSVARSAGSGALSGAATGFALNLIRPLGMVAEVAHWGRPGIGAGDWVMLGGKTWSNYILSGKWQMGLGNEFAAYATGEVSAVASSAINYPSGLVGILKAGLGQRVIGF